MEKPKRLAPTRETLRELYLKSGNRCAFPNCKKVLFNKTGNFVAQICHIEAAEPNGERFNPLQSNEERRHVSNLVMLCYDHHVETNDISIYTVDVMYRIKSEHEAKFSDVVGAMLITVVDQTKLSQPSLPTTLRKMNDVLEWKSTDEELNYSLETLTAMVKRLADVPLPSRELLLVLIDRGNRGEYSASLAADIPDVQQATGLTNRELNECFSVLDRHGFTYDNGKTDTGVQSAGVSELDGWPIWVDIKKFCKKSGVAIENFVINMDFSLLD